MQDAVSFIKSKTGNFTPEIGIILGSGLGSLADDYCEIAVPYADIPGFKTSTVAGHKGRLVFADICGKKIVMMQGRFHYYEGHPMETVVYPVKVMKQLGVKTLIITNAAGGVNTDFKPSDLMIITDHINFMGTNPLIGKNDDTLGVRFPDMSEVYSKKLVTLAENCAQKLGISLHKGVYMALTGPSYETPAEVKMAKILGADAVGMSTVPEAIVGRYCSMDILGISCICNKAAGVSTVGLTHSEVIAAADSAKQKFITLVLAILKNLN